MRYCSGLPAQPRRLKVLRISYSLGQPKGEPKIAIVVSMLVALPALMTYLHRLAYRGGSPAFAGARLGAIVGLVFVIPLNLVHTSFLGAPWILVAVDTPLHVIEQGLMGLVIGLVAGRPMGTPVRG